MERKGLSHSTAPDDFYLQYLAQKATWSHWFTLAVPQEVCGTADVEDEPDYMSCSFVLTFEDTANN